MTTSATTYILPVNRHGQITLPKAFRKLFDIESGKTEVSLTVTDENTAAISRRKTTEEVLANLDKMRENLHRNNPSIKTHAEGVAGKTVRELREEFDNSLEGEAYYYKYSPAYYYEQHPDEPRTPEIQAEIDKHNKLLDYLAAADPEHADRLEEYRAN